MDVDERAVLISIRPRFADAILNATKTVELRRSRINVPVGTRFLIYSTSPVMAVVGTAVLEHIQTDTPDRLWPRIKHLADVTPEEYTAYFARADEAIALHLSDPALLDEPKSLEQLRSVIGIEPNQSFRYVNAMQADLIASAKLAS